MKKFFSRKLEGSQKLLIILLLLLAIVLVIFVVIDIFFKSDVSDNKLSQPEDYELEEPATVVSYEDIISMPQIEKDQFEEDVPANIIVPDVNTELSEEEKKEIALPTIVVEAAPGSDSSFRDFNIIAENDIFIPNKIIANVGDTIHVDFTSIDKDYDIVFPSYDMMQIAKMGQTKMLEFQALKEGSFTYYCSSCGGPASGPKGSFIIVQP